MAITAEMVLEYQIAKATLEQAKERFDKVENELCQEMLTTQTKSDLIDVRGETVRIDEQGLRGFLGGRQFNKVCTKKVDRRLLEAAVMDPMFPCSPEELSAFVSITTNKPFVRVTKDTGDPE
jgi:hypothetical protein